MHGGQLTLGSTEAQAGHVHLVMVMEAASVGELLQDARRAQVAYAAGIC